MVSAILSRLVILVFGTLYPAYASYKAVRTKNVKEYVKWMMYWIVFALFCTVETFSDFFLSWFPFYYEFKIIFVLWMLSPITQGSSFLFKKFVHPQLARKEKDIDEMIEQATKQGYSAFVDLGNKGIKVILKSVIMGQSRLADHLRRSYSTSDLSNDGHDIVQRHENIGDQEDKEDELDNRLIEDRSELAKRSTSSVNKSRGSSSVLSLSSVKEEDGEDGEHLTTETFTLPPSTRRHHSVREDKTATRQLRCQSLPPLADRNTKPLIIASTNLESKKKYLAKFQTVEKKELINYHPLHVSSELDSKRHLLTRALSQDSGTTNMLNTISSLSSRSSRKAREAGLAKALSEYKEKNKGKEYTIIKSEDVSTDNQHLSEGVPYQEKREHEIRQEELLEKNVEKYTEEDFRFTRKSVPRFQNDLPVIAELAPLDYVPQSVIIDRPEVFSLHSSQTEHPEEQRLNLLLVDNLGNDLSNLIYLNVEDDMEDDDQCPTPLAKDSPPNLSQDDEIKDADTETDNEMNVQEDDSANIESDTFSVSDFGSLEDTDIDFEECSEGSDSVTWETLSEASTSDSLEFRNEGLQDASALKDECGPWSAPSSPASFIRGSKYEEDSLPSWRIPTSSLVQERSKSKSETSWVRPVVEKQKNFPGTVSRSILNSWPSPSHISDSVSSYRTRSRISASSSSYGQSFDPFQTWHPRSRSEATSYRSQSIDSSVPAFRMEKISALSDRSVSRPYVRSPSLDLTGGEAMYRRILGSAYKTNPLSLRTHSHLKPDYSLSTGRSPTSLPSRYSTRTYPSYTSKK